MTDRRVNVRVDASGNLNRQFQQYTQSVSRFTRNGNRQMAMLRSGAAAAGRGLDSIANRYTALATGVVGGAAARFAINQQTRLTRLGISADISADKIEHLKQQIYDAAQQPDIRVDPSQIISAVEEIVEKTGDLSFAQENIENLGVAIQATGAQGQDIGAIAAEFQKMGITAREDVREALDILTVQGKEGAFTLQNLARLGPRVVTAYTAMGRTGVPAIREMGAALQVVRQGTGSAEMAATAFEALLRTLGDSTKLKTLQEGGIQIFDPEALERGQEILRPINELMVDIIKRTEGKKSLLSQVFDAEAVRAFNAAGSEFLRTGQVESLERFMNVQADGSTIMNDSARAANDASQALGSLLTAGKRLADETLTEPLQGMADILNSIDPESLNNAFRTALKLAGLLGTAIVGRKLFNAGSALGRGGATGLGGGGAGASGIPGVAAGVTPVYVVNMKGAMGGGGKAGAAGAAGGAASQAGKRSFASRALRGAGAATVAGSAGYAAGTVLDDMVLQKTDLGMRIRDSIGEGVAGILAAFGNDQAQRSREAMQRGEQMDIGGTLEIKIDQDGRARVNRAESNVPDQFFFQTDTGPILVGD